MAGVEQGAGKSEGVIGEGLKKWNQWNKITLTAEIGVALLVPALAAPALVLAAIDGAQIIAIDAINKENMKKKKANAMPITVFEAKKVNKTDVALAA